jgi:hypothetical protein
LPTAGRADCSAGIRLQRTQLSLGSILISLLVYGACVRHRPSELRSKVLSSSSSARVVSRIATFVALYRTSIDGFSSLYTSTKALRHHEWRLAELLSGSYKPPGLFRTLTDWAHIWPANRPHPICGFIIGPVRNAISTRGSAFFALSLSRKRYSAVGDI